jgi:AcrR family transcriptional regulator
MAEMGFAAMTTAAVARKAGVAEGTIYRHFPSKESLAEAVFAEAWNHLSEEMEALLPPRELPGARLRAFLPVGLQVHAARPCDSAICHQEHIYWMNTMGLCVMPAGPERFVGLLEEAIRLAQAAGEVRAEVDPRLVANFMFHGVGNLMERFLKPSPDGRPPAYAPEVFLAQMDDFFAHALFQVNA